MSLKQKRVSGCYIKYTIKINGFCFKQKYYDENFLREKFKKSVRGRELMGIVWGTFGNFTKFL